jgi:hypothetical protein
MFRISRAGSKPIFDVEFVEQIEPAIRSSPPGRCHIDEISADPLRSGHTSRAWGKLVRHTDGRTEAEPHPWSD